MTTTATTKAVPAHLATAAGSVDILAGLRNVFGGVATSIESSIAAVTSATTSAAASSATASSAVGNGSIFSTIAQAETAVAEIRAVIADAEAGRWSNEPGDVLAMLKTVFAILATYGVNVPLVSAIVAALPAMPAAA